MPLPTPPRLRDSSPRAPPVGRYSGDGESTDLRRQENHHVHEVLHANRRARDDHSNEPFMSGSTVAPAPSFVDDTASLDALVAEVAEQEYYAIDTEFHTERTYYP